MTYFDSNVTFNVNEILKTLSHVVRAALALTCTVLFRKQLFSPDGFIRPLIGTLSSLPQPRPRLGDVWLTYSDSSDSYVRRRLANVSTKLVNAVSPDPHTD
jgi:hypothetical protein